MPSATPPRDVSVTWPIHTCGARHLPGADCPPPDTWLVAGSSAGRQVAVRPRRNRS